MKGKIGIISLYRGSYNYGGVLQAYAMNYLVERCGYEAEQILYKKEKGTKYRIKRLCTKSPKRLLNRSLQIAETKLCDNFYHVNSSLQLRKKAFLAFKKDHIRDSGSEFNQQSIFQTLDNYDGFICGSDQIWNSNTVDDVYLLNFVPEETKKFSYAASIAGPIRSAQYPQYRQALKRLDAVSVREDSAVDQLRQIADVPVNWVLDPVLMLTRSEWEKVSAGEPSSEPYVLCYFLGNDRVYRKLARSYADRKGLRLVTLPYTGNVHSFMDQRFGDNQLYDVGPDRFLTLIRDAKCVLTDSFHAVALCHIFQTPFWALRRTAQHISEDRVGSLLRHSGLTERLICRCNSTTVDRMVESAAPDFTHSELFLSQMRVTSERFLQMCLGENG